MRALTWLLGLAVAGAAMAQTVETVRAPHDGFRPQLVQTADGTLHLVQGHAKKMGDLYYLKKPKGGEWSAPIKVNTAAQISAAHAFAVGKGGRVHVLIRPNPRYLRMKMPEKKRLGFWDLKYMLYCRLNDAGTAFSEERDLSADAQGFEGVGAVLASADDDVVHAFFHGKRKKSPGEWDRQLFHVRSEDGGATFSAPVEVKTDIEGACACCPMVGMMEKDRITLAIRNTAKIGEKLITKDAYLLESTDGGKTFSTTFLEAWKAAGCPGATFSLASAPSGRYVAWRTMKKVKFAKLGEKLAVVSPTLGAQTRVPVLAVNKDGVVLFAWATKGKRKQPGHLVYELFDKSGKSLGSKQVVRNGIDARWGGLAAVARPDGSFLLLYDGAGVPVKKGGGSGGGD